MATKGRCVTFINSFVFFLNYFKANNNARYEPLYTINFAIVVYLFSNLNINHLILMVV